MTEQPPPSAEATALAYDTIKSQLEPFLRDMLTATAKNELRDILAFALDRFAERVCEQRGAAETERLVEIIKAIAKQYVDEVGFDTGWRMACERITLHIRAPAEQETPQPGCGAAELRQLIYRAVADANTACKGEILPCTNLADQCACWSSAEAVLATIKPLLQTVPAVPSALASTGEQPEGGDALLREIALAAAHHLAGYDGDLVNSLAKDIRARRDRVEELLRQAGIYPPTDAGGLSSTDTEEER